MKTLNTIQTLCKIGKILSKIAFIFCVIGAVGCAAGVASLPFADTGVFNIGGVTIHGLIVNHAGIDLDSLYPMMTGVMIVCIGEAVTAKKAEGYFTHELTAGTPFTFTGAKELLQLGIVTICVPLGTQILAQIVSEIIAEIIHCSEAWKPDNGGSVTLGVMFIFMSLLCRYGAELKDGSHYE